MISLDLMTPYKILTPKSWQTYRQSHPMTLTEEEIVRLRGFNETVSLSEVKAIYLPLSRFISMHYENYKALASQKAAFWGKPFKKPPYIIGVSGSVAVGKSTTSRLLKALLSRWQQSPSVSLVTTDNFIYPNHYLRQQGLMHKKGFPESFDLKKLLHFLSDVKAGKNALSTPCYSHEYYDILPNRLLTINQPDILILEGLNVLQKKPSLSRRHKLFVSDFLDFTIYVDAQTEIIESWYLERFLAFREQAKNNPDLFFHRFWQMTADEALAYAKSVWQEVNEKNLIENILPFKHEASLILNKTADHSVSQVALRSL